MNNNKSIPQSQKIDLNHYVRLLLEKKIWIVLITIFVSVLWYFIYPVFLHKEEQYYFLSVIRFDDPRNTQSASGIDDRFTYIDAESKIRVIQTTPFLREVIDSLSLNIVSRTHGLSRENIFSEIKLDKNNLKYGKYELRKNKTSVDIRYTNKNENKEDFLIKTINIGSDSILNLNTQGISAGIYANIFNDNDKIIFNCIPTRFVLSGLRNSLSTHLNRNQTLLNIRLQHRDPVLGAKITNIVASHFLSQSLEFKRSRTNSAMQALEEQLESSKEQLEKVEEELKNFRERNPNIYLTENLAEYNRTVLDKETERDRIQNNLNRLNHLINEKNITVNFVDRLLIYKEILTFLEDQEIAGLTALNEQYNALIEQRTGLLEQNFSEENPRVTEVNRNLQSMHKTIDERINQYQNIQESRLQQVKSGIANSERNLRLSPRKELQLAKLQRDRDSKSEVYSSVLLRYNEIKTAHASITPDAYLLESAQVPVVQSGFMERIMKFAKLLVGPILGLALALGFFVGVDLFWHRARSVNDMEVLLKLPVLATIPLLKTENNIENMIEIEKRMDPLLVTIGYTPSLGGEAFRNLRTRLILEKGKEAKQQLVITSLKPNEGKSLVASNLAITFAQIKKATLLIDADIRRGVIHNSFLCKKKPGLADLLARTKEINEENIGKIIQKTTIPNLSLITSGSSVPNPTELLIGDKIEKMINILKEQFQYLIFDTPPIEFIPDAFVINQYVANMLLTTRYGETNLNQLRNKLNEYNEVSDTIVGTVLNASTNILQKKYQAYSYYKY